MTQPTFAPEVQSLLPIRAPSPLLVVRSHKRDAEAVGIDPLQAPEGDGPIIGLAAGGGVGKRRGGTDHAGPVARAGGRPAGVERAVVGRAGLRIDVVVEIQIDHQAVRHAARLAGREHRERRHGAGGGPVNIRHDHAVLSRCR